MRRIIWVLVLLALSFGATADEKSAELQGLYAAVSALNQEQQALFQQFQMLQELRRTNDKTIYASQLRPPLYSDEVPMYADIVQAQKDASRRGEELSQQAEQLYGQYSEVASRKAQLQQRIFELTLAK